MKRKLFLGTAAVIAVQLVMGLAALSLVVSCGGGGAKAKKSGLKANEIFGMMPALTVDYRLADEALDEKYEADKAKAVKKSNAKMLTKAKAEYEKNSDALEAKYKADTEAEAKKIAGKNVPFTVSDNFSKLNIDVASLKVSENGRGVAAVFNAKTDFWVSSYAGGAVDVNDYSTIWCQFLSKDGEVIGKGSFLVFINLAVRNGKSFVKGENLTAARDEGAVPFLEHGIYMNEEMANFASVKFVTLNETR